MTLPTGHRDPLERTPPLAIELVGVTAGYGGRSVVHDVTLRVEPGELVGIVGPSGVGKTTVLRLVTGGCERHAGDVRVAGRAVERSGPAPPLGYVPQVGSVDPDFPLTVEQVVLLGRAGTSRRRPWFSRRERARAAAVLERLGMAHLAGRPIAHLSGGERQRMFVARALLRDVPLLLLDEPTAGVDLATTRDVLRLVGELHEQGLTVVLTTHDLNWVAATLPRVVCFDGSVVADGPPARAMTAPALSRTFGTDVHVLDVAGRVVVVAPGAPGGDAARRDEEPAA